MTSHKPTAGFWITVALVVVLVGYPVSFGPASWISSRATVFVPAVEIIYHPVLLAWGFFGGTPVSTFLHWYSQLCAPSGWYWSMGNEWIHP
jgi:hypothetical protein